MWQRKLSNAEKTLFTQKIIEDLNHRHLTVYGKHAHTEKALCVVRIINFMLENISDEITLEDLEKICGKTRFDICRVFKHFYDVTPIKWMWKVRLALAREFIHLAPEWSLTDISYACGFSSLPHFSRSFSKTYNESPLKFKQNVLRTTRPESKKETSDYDFIFGIQRNNFSRSMLINNLHSL
ncbi:helix-turn-helix transcriptional regulator [Rahnella perminowiae]|uniref:Helix-turn-helix transcriptional regulator n=2 Tax=Rahnella perminowiae TaxID=2816244 RepID=A0ABS6L488_9GAMM|nr:MULTISPECIES: AraC family transcriptional regulator [Rahnella]UJD92061.1 helix-turn-helix transcriptional regulator [Rahnella aquatilis]MBU9824009.1 helix-turn-helix transcriptional regulator [Rahnella perminowiae]MBU9836359.1 helix-turn-helix transcriptional regulator [Rahnella perminowiae]MCR9003546.1 AraC family transcriptional regulator [Rahnella perminowiae]MCX2941958.1 AraC family transcriptional regulator [Rahnella perminowiae]